MNSVDAIDHCRKPNQNGDFQKQFAFNQISPHSAKTHKCHDIYYLQTLNIVLSIFSVVSKRLIKFLLNFLKFFMSGQSMQYATLIQQLEETLYCSVCEILKT